MWFTELIPDKIGRITPGGQITEFAVPGGHAALTKIVSGPDGALWFTEQSRGIGRITTDGSITEFAVPTLNSQPYGIAAGPDGSLWFTEFAGNAIGRITPAGIVTEFAVPTAGSNPSGIAAGPDGNLWFGEFLQTRLGKLDLRYTDLAIKIEAQPSVVSVGTALTFTITVANVGSTEATKVIVTDPLPLGTPSSISATPSQGTVELISPLLAHGATTTVVARLGTLLPGFSATVTLVFSPLRSGTITNSVVVRADESQRTTGA